MYVADLEKALELFGPRLYQLYGQGESPMTITGLTQRLHADSAHPRWRERLGSCGVARTGVLVKVVDDDDRDVPPGEIGEVVTRSDCVMEGYWQNPEANAETLRGGWLHTGDLGSMDEDGFLTLRDRSKDMIICGGSNIYPREIEEVLLRHPDLVEASVVGRPHPDWGEEVVAFRRRAARRRRSPSADARPALPRPHRPLQAAARLPLCRGAAEEQLRQGAEDRAAAAIGGTVIYSNLNRVLAQLMLAALRRRTPEPSSWGDCRQRLNCNSSA